MTHEKRGASITRERFELAPNQERQLYLEDCCGDGSRAESNPDLQDELDTLLQSRNYATPEHVPSENISIAVEGTGGRIKFDGLSPYEASYRIRVVWRWPAGQIVHEYTFRDQPAGRMIDKEVNWIYGNGRDSLPERTVGSHGLPYVSSGELGYLHDLLERCYEGHIGLSKGPRPSPHPNRFARSING